MKNTIVQAVLVCLVTGAMLGLTATAAGYNKMATSDRLNAIVATPSELTSSAL